MTAVALAGAIAFTQTPGIAVVTPGAAPKRVTSLGLAPAFSPDGRRLATIVRGEIWTMDADGSRQRRLTRTAEPEGDPVWAPDGRALAFTRAGGVWTIRADGLGERRLVPNGESPTWAPDGTRVAYARDGDLFVKSVAPGVPQRLTENAFAHDPAWSPDGRRLAYASDEFGNFEIHLLDVAARTRSRVTYDEGADRFPTWSPDGRRLAWERNGSIWAGAGNGSGQRRLATGRAPSWQPLPRRPELLPDLEQRPPTRGCGGGGPGNWHVGFTTAVDNIGDGAFVVVGRRPAGAATMRASQRVSLGGERYRWYADVGRLRYDPHAPHYHWHFQPYARYELRKPDGKFFGRDSKQGFCLADHYGVAPGDLPRRARGPVFLGNCDAGVRGSTYVLQGTSVGYTDIYPGFFHGQSVRLSGVPAGVYLLVNRSNPELRFRELRYDNNAASMLIRLSWPHGQRGAPVLTQIRSCRTEVCPARPGL